MIRRFLRSFSTTIAGGAFLIAVAAVMSRILGLVRDNLLAKLFAGTPTIDIYQAAFKVPDFIFNIIVLGALSASFIPTFVAVRQQSHKSQAFRSANAINQLVALALIIIIIIALIITPQLAHWLMLERPIEQQVATTTLMRLMLISVLFFGLSNIVSGILQAERRILAFAFAPLLYNLGIIAGIVLWYPRFGLVGLAFGVLSGAIGHWLIQLPSLWRTGFRYQLLARPWAEPGVMTLFRMMPGRAFALGMTQLNAMVLAILALRLPAGSLGVWTWADNLQNVPINVFGVSLALSVFPVFSQAFADNNIAHFKQEFSKQFRRILFIIVPTSVAVLLLRAQFVRLILGSFGDGRFDWTATIQTSQVLGVFSLAMFAQATIPLLARSFFAQHDTRTPVIMSAISTGVNIVLGLTLVDTLGLYGLALAVTISSFLQMVLLLMSLRLKVGDLEDTIIVRAVWRITAAALGTGLIIQGMKYLVAELVDMRTVPGLFLQTSASLAAGIIVYSTIAWYFHFAEIDILRQYWKKLRAVFKRLIPTLKH